MATNIENVFYKDVVQRSQDFEIITFEGLYNRHENKLKNLFVCHRVHFNALFIILKGESYHTIDCKKILLKPGTIVPIVKGQVHVFEEELKVEGVIITFTDAFILNNTSETNLFHFLQLYNSKSIQVDIDNLFLIEPFVQLLFKTQGSSNDFLKADFLKTILFSLLIQIKRLSPLEQYIVNSNRFADFVRFKKLIVTHFSQTHNAKDYAVNLGVSYKYLNDVCKEVTNKTAKAFIDDWVLLEIKRNLSERKYSMKEIAFKTGFEEPSNFIRFFKKHENTTPKLFLEQL